MIPPLKNPIFCAFDTPDVKETQNLCKILKGSIGGMKLGLEFFSSAGPYGYSQVSDIGLPIFLDLKFHDIPNTVARAVLSLLPLEPDIMTIHTQGGGAMMVAAAKAADEAKSQGLKRPKIIGVTILTSLDQSDLGAMGVQGPVRDQVARLGRLAKTSGLDGCVCSPFEIEVLREVCGEDFLLVVPGIRPKGAATRDQKRVMGPNEALKAGADILVIGRPITASDDPSSAVNDILTEIGS
ncbi:MAG: orotidine-5'-phosphate decarboxylase [Sphingomonadales bacterium]|jgi:orotidine-5'-phosphate decarboxylase